MATTSAPEVLLKWRYGSDLSVVVEKSASLYVLLNLRAGEPRVTQLLPGGKHKLIAEVR
jgi:hypothetical protein